MKVDGSCLNVVTADKIPEGYEVDPRFTIIRKKTKRVLVYEFECGPHQPIGAVECFDAYKLLGGATNGNSKAWIEDRPL